MKSITIIIMALLILFTVGCGEKPAADQNKSDETVAKKEVNMKMQKKADSFLNTYQGYLETKSLAYTTTEWEAETTGTKEAYDAHLEARKALNKLHSDKTLHAGLQELLKNKEQLEPITARCLAVAELAFKGNQLPKELLDRMDGDSSAISQAFNTYRAKIDGKDFSNNDLLDKLKNETDSAKRKEIWEALKQVGNVIAPKVIELAKVRNEAALQLGYKNFWEMRVRLQEYDPDQLISIFAELETVTNEPFKKMKAELDGELAARFKINVDEITPWHYDNPFFQQAPPSAKLDLDEFFKDKTKEEIVEISKKFCNDIGLPADAIIAKSDLYEREGKKQHAFCTDIDRKGDTRVLVNVKPTAEWMDTMLHELGHGVYDVNLDMNLPFVIRQAAHSFTTEGIAMLFGALPKTPVWLVTYAGADPQRVKDVETALLEQRRREQLIFARWTMVMFNFEKGLYENPDQDLNKLWWDLKERFQLLKRPEGRNSADWASKIHVATYPVYYHNYMLGELFSAQLRNTLIKLVKHEGPSHTLKFNEHKEFGQFLKEKVFQPGQKDPWPIFIKNATGEPLTAKYFAEELK